MREQITTLITKSNLAAALLIASLLVFMTGCDKDRDEKYASAVPAAPLAAPAGAAADSSVVNECRFTEDPITIDGVADEPAWKNAQVIENFYLPWLKDKARPSRTKTRAMLLWDREYLYFHAEMEDTDIYAGVTEHDGPEWNDDVFELFFKPTVEKPGYYEFEINAANTVLDMFLPQRRAGGYDRFKRDRPFNLTTAVKLRGTLNKWQDKDEGWSVEGRIPWRDFLATGGRPAENEIWQFALCRGDVSVDSEGVELSTNAPLKTLNYADFHYYEDYAKLKFIGPPEKSSGKPFGIEKRIPWTENHIAGTPEPPPPFTVKRILEKLNIPCPMHVFHEPGTENLFLLHQLFPWGGEGRLLRVKEDSSSADIQTLLAPNRIFYGIAFHPEYEKNGFIYMGSNGPMTGPNKTTRVSRYTVARTAPYAIDPKSELIVLEWDSDGHNGGDLAFGKDGMLYVSSGDGTSDSDKNLAGQDLSKLNSKVLRLDVLHPEPGKTYAIPADNPFVGQPNVRPETWAYGLRNPWRLTADRQTGDIYVGNNGQDLWEQVYLIKKSENYGWSVQEGSHEFYPARQRGPHPITGPIVEHGHAESRSLTGGQVYYGTRFPELRGMYIYGDWSTGKIWGLKQEGGKVIQHLELASTPMHITGFGFDSHGELIIADHSSGYYTLERAAPQDPSKKFPLRLSETGLFASVKDHKPNAALIGYSVNSPLWSDGAYKERYMALPGADSQINYTRDRGWDFPEGTVLVKSFALEKEHGNPQSRKWIETRLMVKQLNLWAGYSYIWNDEQTDAVLVAKEGVDRDYSIQDASAPGGTRKQTWHYPSRTECMVCHSRAFNFVLGLSEAQMNRNHDYNGVVDNQLRTLEHLGLFKSKWADIERGIIWHEGKNLNKTNKEADEYTDVYTATRLQREAPYTKLLPHTPEGCQRLANPYDAASGDLNSRARAYLHANCAHCHVMAGGGNAMMELEFITPTAETNIFGVKPLHDNFNAADAKIVAPGSPERSVLLHRISKRGPGQMPPLASSMVDDQAVKLIDEWIRKMP